MIVSTPTGRLVDDPWDVPFWGFEVSEALPACVRRTSLIKCLTLASTSFVGKCIYGARGRFRGGDCYTGMMPSRGETRVSLGIRSRIGGESIAYPSDS